VTELDLTAIRERAARATLGPWWAWDRGVGWEIGVGTDVDDRGRPEQVLPEGQRTDIGRREDAEFIAACRTDVPALVSEVERLRDEVRILENSDALDIVTANAEIKRLKRLLGPPEMPTVDSYESMAAALVDERAEVVRHCDRIAELTTLLAEILRYFPGPFRDTVVGVRSTFVPVETLDGWRSRLERAS
jgi:hypothetical protein